MLVAVILLSTVLFPAGSAAQSSPQFDQGEYTITINQNAQTNFTLQTVHCSYSGSVCYMIDGYSPNVPFLAIDSNSGAISLTTNSINLASQNFSVFLRCFDPADSSLRDFTTLVVSHVDENEFPPQFTHMDLQVSISESRDFTVDPYVIDVNATDNDMGIFGSIIYGVEGTIPNTFQISPSNGEITLQSSLDFETDDQYIFIVTASNPLIPSTDVVRSAELLVTVNVIDANDVPPTFTESNYQHLVNETFLPEYPRPDPGFFTVRCTDPDSNQEDITYAISPDSSPFILNTTTGSFSVTQDLDYETRTSYSFTVMCFDNGSPNLTASALVDIIINSVNEYEPVVVTRPGTIVILETVPVDTLVASADPSAPLPSRVKYRATDQDAGPDGNVTYTRSDDPDAQFFTVDLNTGDVRLREVIDVDTRITSGTFQQLLFSISVCDRFPPVEECPNFEMRILVFTVNEFQPTFAQENYTVSFNESTLPGTTVVIANCTDGDVGNGAFAGIDFVIPQHTFSIDRTTGVVITTTTLDYETVQSYGFEVRCRDNGGNEDRAVVRVEVIAENDNQPRFDQSSYVFQVSRTTPTSRYYIGNVVARDADIGFGGTLQFTIDANGFFDITVDGAIQLFSSLLHYADSSLFFNVHVSDGSNMDSAAVVIQLTSGNLNQPEFVLGSRAVEVSELSPVGTSIISVLCNDTDNGTNGEIRYFLNARSTDIPFRIDPITGEVSVSSVLVLPLNSSNAEYLLEIRCEDRGVPMLADEAVIFIRVFQDDSGLLEIQNNTIVTSVSEDANINDVVVTIEATGLDSGRLIFRLEDQSVPGVFIIDPPSGRVSVAAALDREQTSEYQMTVAVTEVRNTPGPVRSDNATLTIYVRDVNDNNPTCDTTMLAITIPETLATNSSLLHLNCSDLDFGENGRISYNLSNSFGLLSISNIGEITLVGHLNVTQRNTLLLAVTVSDQGLPSRTNRYQVTIFVSSTNRFAPSFVNLPTTLEVSEAQPIQEVIFIVEASDPDRGSFGKVTYEIVNHQENDPFSIFANTGGLFLTRKLNFFEHQLYQVNISASDGDFTVSELLNISVLDANEFTPHCRSLLLTTTISENISPNQTLLPQLFCSDSDEGSNGDITFTIVSGNEGDAFEISRSGSLKTLLTLDFEFFNQYVLTIEISDSGSPSLSLNATYLVIVEPVNEFSPIFELSLYNASITENVAVGTSVLQVSAIDGDHSAHRDGQVTYSILGLNQPVFSISEFGLLQVTGVLDREEMENYRFVVQASDRGQHVNMNTTTIEIIITDVDDNPPQFVVPLYVAVLNHTFRENGTFPVTTVECTDRDLSLNAAVTYSIDETTEDSHFFEIRSSGLIQVRRNLSISRIYTLAVFCMGPAPANFSDTAIVSVEAIVDSNITFYPSNNYNASILENTTPVYAILAINASATSGSSLTYTLLNGGSIFSIHERTGSLRLIASLDYETTRSYALRVQASDNGSPPNVGEALVLTLVENVNDETPLITTVPSTTISLPEGFITSPLTIEQYQCTDADDGVFGQVSFWLESGNIGGAFSLSEDGTLQLVGNLDYESTQSYTLVAACEDGGDPPRTDSITIPITVSPINDNAPQFASESIDISVSEAVLLNSGIGTPIEATDADLPPHNNLRYRIISGDSNPQTFSISSTTGQLYLVRTLDFETTPSFTLVVEAQDSGGQIAPEFPVLNDTITVDIMVLDYNDNQPHFLRQIYTGTVQEGAPVGGQVSLDDTISCSDLDSGSNGDTSLHITTGNTNNVFAIQDTGLITVAASLDFEVQRTYHLTIECRDNGELQLASQASVIISLTDVNEFGPIFNQSLYTFQVPETTSIGSEVGMILAVDRDAGLFGTISYTFSNASRVPFTLDTTTGVIITSDSLDYETQEQLYVFEAQANDNSGLEDITTVVITITNSDDNTPRFTMSNYFASVSENASSGVSVAQVSCSDADDQADNMSIHYALSNSSVPFLIEEQLGTISVLGALDLERIPNYILAIICTDSAGNSATAFTTISLTPVNDFPPVFTGTPYALGLTENTMIGSSVFQLMATDDDIMRYNDITFSFTSGNEQRRFSIDPSSGVISVRQIIDREIQPQYELGVLAQNVIPPGDTSGSHPLSDSTTLTIIILDINDNDPVLMPSQSLIVSVLENNSSNIVLAEFNCYDQDFGDNGTTSFSIASESTLSSGNSALTPFFSGSGDIAPDSSFEILSNGTLITTDYIHSSTHLEVICTDHGTPQRASTATITVHVVNTNDHAPHFLQASYRISVREDQIIGRDIHCFTAVDMDSSQSRDGIIEYSLLPQSLSGQDVNRFSIRENSGCVFALLPLDYGSQSSYQYTIIATDSGQPPLNGTATLIISVVDVIRDSPQFVDAPYTRSISEGVGSGTLVVHTSCIDPDQNDSITYRIESGNNGSIFSIDSENGDITISPSYSLDYETTQTYTLGVVCSDSYHLSASAIVFITVTPVNEFTPTFGARVVGIPEHSISGASVTQLVWNDGDSGPDGEVTFIITSGNTNNVFFITSDGRILVSGVLDREVLSHYSLQIQIKDLSSNPSEQRSSENHVNITITDINDHTPVFGSNQYTFDPLDGSEPQGHYIGMVHCTDDDIGSNAMVTYQIVSNFTGTNLVSVDGQSGNLTTVQDLETRELDTIFFIVQCIDGGSNPLSSTTRVIVMVDEINRHAPEFTNSSYYVLVQEDTQIILDIIVIVHAADGDSGVNGQVRYHLEDDFDHQFFINEDTGELSLLKPLDFETRIEYLLIAEATDSAEDGLARMTSNASITIEVTGVNEYTPMCPHIVYHTFINRTTSGEVINLSCTDGDAGPDGGLNYNITGGNEEQLFLLNTDGRVIVPAPVIPDIGTENYTLEVNISDLGIPPRQTQVKVIILYSFENLASPTFNESVYNLSVSELAEVGHIVATFEATDTDRSLQGMVTYSLDGANSFHIDPASGQLFIARPLDWETNISEVFTIIVQDSDPYSPKNGSATVKVEVQNENDNAPQCNQTFYLLEILTSAQPGDTVLNLSCTDPDGDTLTYQLVTTRNRRQASTFAIEQRSGLIYVAGLLTQSTTTMLSVLVSDGGEYTTGITVSVQIRFANVEPPVFSNTHYTFDVPEDTALLSAIGSIFATDNDSNSIDLRYSTQDPAQTSFYVNPSTGDIILTVPLDYETQRQYSFTVQVEDGGSYNGTNQLLDTASVVVNVLNTNDNLPQLENDGIFGATLSENTSVNTNILNISCTDRDAAPYGTPTIFGDGFSSTPFELVGVGGKYTVRVSQTLPGSGFYTVNITCSDTGGQSTNGQVFIFITETEAPAFNHPAYEWSLRESAPTGSEFTDVLATSFDGSEITYAITDGNGNRTFYIHPATGAVSLVSTLDYETQRTHGLIIRAVDRANRQSSVLLFIQVLDVNDQVPLTPPSVLLQVTQNAPVGFPVGTLQCIDGDSSPNATMVNFTFIPASEVFSVDSYGVVRLEGTLDDTPVYVLPVTCYDLNMPETLSTGVVTIEVNFINQNTPEFDFTRYIFSVCEDAGMLSLVGTVQATDRDVGSYGEVTYAITSGNPDTFYIESEVGSIHLLTDLDHEDSDSYLFIVEAIDGGLSAPDSAQMTGTTTVLVMVEDANDNVPTLNQPSYVRTIATNHTVRTPVLSVNCNDHDLGGRSGVTYSLNPDIEHFIIRVDGTILLAKEQTNQAVYNFNVVCNDVGIPTLSSSAMVTIIVESETPSQYAPTFEEDHYTFTVPENQIVSSTIGQVHASISGNSQINVVYAIESGNSRGHFHIASTIGNITLISPLNATEHQQYIVTIRASNALLNSSFTLAAVNIRVIPVNSHPPIFSTQFYAARLREVAGVLTPVRQVQCSDPDTNTHISYEISGFGAQAFNITQNGLIWVAGEINYETQMLYTLYITCSDDGDTPFTAQATVRIEVLPANEFVPEFTQPVYEFNVTENSFGTRIGRVVATDDDTGSQGEVTYHLQDPGNFSVVFVEPSTGDVLVANNLDYETQHFWNLSVIARDGAGAKSYATLQINVSNVNDMTPVITPSTVITTVRFNSPAGYPIQTYSCTDEDGSSTVVSILNGNSLGYFELNTFDQLVWTGTAGDLSTDIVISLIVQCQDLSALEQVSLAHIVITVHGGGSTISPQFSQEIYSTSIPESTPLDTSVLTVSASATSASLSNTTYELVNVPSNFPFGIHALSGVINTIRSLNYEMTSNYVFTVRAYDATLATSGVALVNISIEDSNDNPPQLFPLLHTVTLPEDFPLTSIATFVCIDNDSGRSGTINFMLELPSGNESAPFNISNSGTVELTNPLDFEIARRYNITIVCSDMGDSPLLAYAVLLVTVIGVNEFPPQFESNTYNFAVYENVSAGDLVGMLPATDGDAGMDGIIRYEITSGNGSEFFRVNSIGEVYASAITTTLPLNATQQRSLQLYVRITDPGALSDSTLVTIVVLDVNEAPVFSEDGSYFTETTTEQPANSSILNLTCFDTDIGDNALLHLEITSNPTNLDIFLHTDGSEGAVVSTVVKNSTFSAGSYELGLRCSDTGNPPLDTNATLIVRVEGPPILSPPVTISVPEDTHLDTFLVNVSATDVENDVTYEITAGNELGHFRIETMNGGIYLALLLDYETGTEHRITITASVHATNTLLSSSTQVTFLVENVNDVQPLIIPSGSQSITLLENVKPTHSIFTYTCMDQETNVTFSLSGSSSFAVQQTGGTGVVQLVDVVDYDQQNRYILNIMCSDMTIGNENVQYHISSVLIIQVTPVNIYAPVFTLAGTVKVPENASIGDVIARVEAVDLDGRGQITYSSISHTDLFLVDSISGNVTLIGQLDYETQNTFSLVVVASDNDNEQGVVTPLTNMTSLTITVTDVNDNHPSCNSRLETASLLSGTYSYAFLHELSCSDNDEGENSLLTYSFVGGSPPSIPGGMFLLNSTTGELGFTGTITTANTLVIYILVSDSGIVPLSTRVTITIQVIPSSMNRPQFDPDVFNVTISEEAPSLTTVLNGTVLQSALSNPLGATVSYVLNPDPRYGNTFIIDHTSGDVVLSSGNLLDFDEGLREYFLVVEATVGGDTATAVVDIVVTDVNDNHPTCAFGLTSASLPSGTYSYVFLIQLPCSDRDEGENSLLTYSFIGGTPPSIPGGMFLLNSTTGELGFMGTITTANTLVIYILVSDSGIVPLSTRVTIIIQVIPSNINRPQFDPDIFNVTISEDASSLTTVLNGTVLQSALSNPLGATVSYILNPDPRYGNTFIIDHTSGDVVLSSGNLLDFDEGLREYFLVVEATVGGDTATAVVDIDVSDYNDNAPRFEHVLYEGTVFENQPLGTSVLTVIACDLDSGNNGEYRFSLEESSDFSVNSTSGEISTKAILDRETHPVYSFVVVATDFGMPQQTGSTLVRIAIEDENDTPPQFSEPHYFLSITNMLPPGTPLLTLEVMDQDITGNISFQITTSDRRIQDIFEIGSRDGILRLKAAFPNENYALQYNFTVEVNDSVSTDTTTVVVCVQSAPSATDIIPDKITTPIPTSVTMTTMEERYTTIFSSSVRDSVSADTTTVVESAPSSTVEIQEKITTPIPTSVTMTTMEEQHTTTYSSSASVTPSSITPEATIPTTLPLPMPFFLVFITAIGVLVILLLVCCIISCCLCCYLKGMRKTYKLSISRKIPSEKWNSTSEVGESETSEESDHEWSPPLHPRRISLPPSLGIANRMFIDSQQNKGGFNNHFHSQDCISLPPIDSPFPSHKPLELEEHTTQL